MIVRHRTASGRLDEAWSFDPERRVIEVLLKMGNVPLAFEVAVCAPDKPRKGAHPILRLDCESWHILPSRFVLTWPGGIEHCVPMNCPIVPELGPGRTLILSNTPPDVDAALVGLSL